MATFLLVISLLLNGIAIFAIVLLFARQNRLLEVEKAQKKMKTEMEDLISAYLAEMKAENEAFIDRFQRLHETSRSAGMENPSTLPGQITKQTEHRQNTAGVNGNEWIVKAGKAFKQQAVQAYKGFAKEVSSQQVGANHKTADTNDDLSSTDNELLTDSDLREPPVDLPRDLFVRQIVTMQQQGLSIEEIAKKMDKGKTEIELLLKFH